MKVLVFGPYAVLTPHLETDLEIIQRHLDQGDQVIFLACNSELLVCDVNVFHNLSRCIECIGRRSTGISFLSQRVKVSPIDNLSEANKRELSALKVKFSAIDELKAYK